MVDAAKETTNATKAPLAEPASDAQNAPQRRRTPVRSSVCNTALIAIPWAAVAALVIAIGVGGLHSERVHKLPRARQPSSAVDWIEDSPHRNGSKIRIAKEAPPYQVEIEVVCRPHAPGLLPGKSCSQRLHRQGSNYEWITVQRGTLGYSLSGSEQNETAGTIAIPKLAAHTFWNADPVHELAVKLTFSPARNATAFHKTLYGLSHDYGGPDRVPWLQTVITHNHGEQPLTVVPRLLWRAYAAVVSFVARLCGYRGFEHEYPVVTGGI